MTSVKLVGGVVSEMTGVWRTRFGPAASSPGAVVVELMASPAAPTDGDRVCVRVSVAHAGRWLWVAHATDLGREWPRVIGPIVAHAQANAVRLGELVRVNGDGPMRLVDAETRSPTTRPVAQ